MKIEIVVRRERRYLDPRLAQGALDYAYRAGRPAVARRHGRNDVEHAQRKHQRRPATQPRSPARHDEQDHDPSDEEGDDDAAEYFGEAVLHGAALVSTAVAIAMPRRPREARQRSRAR